MIALITFDLNEPRNILAEEVCVYSSSFINNNPFRYLL